MSVFCAGPRWLSASPGGAQWDVLHEGGEIDRMQPLSELVWGWQLSGGQSHILSGMFHMFPEISREFLL